MPDRMQPYGDQEQIQVVRDPSIVLPEVRDIGGKISQIGEAAQRAAEPFLRDRAETQALEDAGKASIVKTPEGGYERTNTTQGGGLIYARVYNDALDTRQLNLMSEDYAAQIGAVARQWIDDPQKRKKPEDFFAFASGLGEAMLEAAPASIRSALDTRIATEMQQRVRGFSDAALKIERSQLIDGLKVSLDNGSKDITNIANGGGDPADKQRLIEQRIEQQVDIIQRLHDLGEIGDMAPYLEQLSINAAPERDYVAGARAMLGLGATIGNLDDESLQRLDYWGRYGTDDKGGEGKVGDMTFDTFRSLFPSQHWQQKAGQLANEILTRRVDERNRQELIASMNRPEPETVDDVLKANDNLNYLPSSGMTKQQYAAAVKQFDTFGPVAAQLKTPEGLQRSLQFLAGTGVVPPHTNDALKVLAQSSDPDDMRAAFDFIFNARSVTTGDHWSGVQWFQSLDDTTKSLAMFDAAMRRAGLDTATRLHEIFDNRTGKNPSMGDVMTAFGGDREYPKVADKAIADAFDVDVGALGTANATIRRDFDRFMQINMSLYPQDPQKALEASASLVRQAWVKDPVFADGVGDARLAAEGIPAWFMDQAIKTFGLRGGNLADATFSNGRVKMRALEDAPGAAFPAYELIFFNNRGERVPGKGAIMPVQRLVNGWRDFKREQHIEGQKRAMEEAPVQPYVVARRPDGSTYWKENFKEYDAWVERMRKKKAEQARARARQKQDSTNAAGLAGGFAG